MPKTPLPQEKYSFPKHLRDYKQSDSPQNAIPWPDPRSGYVWQIYVTWELMRGRWEPLSIAFRAQQSNPRPVTADLLRRAPIGALINEYRKHRADGNSWEPGARDPKQWTAKRGRTLTDEELEAVAEVYRLAHESGGWQTEDGRWIVGPVQAVAHVFHVSTSAANKRVRVARDRGFLGPSVGTKAGEA